MRTWVGDTKIHGSGLGEAAELGQRVRDMNCVEGSRLFQDCDSMNASVPILGIELAKVTVVKRGKSPLALTVVPWQRLLLI